MFRAPAIAALLALAVALEAAAPARADDIGARYRERFKAEMAKGVSLRAQRADIDPGGRVALLAGGVRFETKEGARVQVFADGMVVWGEFTQLGKVADALELYAEGNVFLVAFGDCFEADSLYLDLREGEGRLSRATIRSGGGATRGSPILVRAERARVEDGLSTFAGERAELSTCTYHEPHFALTTDAIRIRRAIPGEISRVESGEEEAAEIEADSPDLEVYGTTVLPLPWTLGWDSAWNRWVPRVLVGRSGRFGAFGLGRIPLYPGKDLEAHATVNLYERRGVGLGGGAAWRGPSRDVESYGGFFEAFGIRDRADTDTSTDEPVPDAERLRLKGFHRDDLPLGLRREAELSYLSDRALLPEYFEKEAKQGKEQETALYLRWLLGNMGANLEGRWRLNDFQEQVEYLPRARYFWIGDPFLDRVLPGGRGVYLTSALEASNVRARYDVATGRPSTRVLRLDAEERLDYPFPLGPVQVDPFLLGRYSAWSTGRDVSVIDPAQDPLPDERAVDRYVLGAGVIATTDIWRDIEGFRHIATPSVGYVNVPYVDVPPEELYPVDGVEQARETEHVPVGLRNRLQYWAPGASRPHDLVDWDLTGRIFLRPGRDNDGDRLGPLRSDLRLSPIPMVGARWRSDWDLNEQADLFRSDADVWFRPQSDLRFAVAHRYFEGSYRALEGSVDARLTEKWGLRVSSQYDFAQGRFTNNRVTVARFFHRFVLDLAIDADFGEDDVRFAVHFTPIELYGQADALGGDVQRQQDPLF